MSGSSVTRHPGFIEANPEGQGSLGIGGLVFTAKAGAAINVGQAVYLSGDNEVKAGVVASAALAVGVVVGGVLTGFRCLPEIEMGAPAADTAGQMVLVCYSGVVTCVTKSAVGLGDRVSLGATDAGKIDTAAGDPSIGTALEADGTGGATIRVLVNIAEKPAGV